MTTISNVLYWISTGLMVPVIVLLIIFFVRALMLIGSFFGQYTSQQRVVRTIYCLIERLTPDTLVHFTESLPATSNTLMLKYVQQILKNRNDEARVDFLLAEYEMDAAKNISTSKVLTKMGPILGLMGTLIPMGPALVGLATGDIASMAYNMQVAFATTVVGLVVCAIGFLTQHIKERWALRNLTMLEYVAEVVKQSKKQDDEATQIVG